jgi:hypothetical protein
LVAYDLNGGTGTAPTESPKAAGATFAAASASGITPPSISEQFKEWNTLSDGTGTGYAEGATVTMPAFALTLYAIWEPILYTVTVSSSGGGSVTTSRATAIAGETVTITVSPATGYELVSLTGIPAGVALVETWRAASLQYTFAMPANDVSVRATFAKTAAQTAWEKAIALIEGATFTLTQASSTSASGEQTESQARYALAEQINALIASTGFVISPYDIVIFLFNPAVAGSADNPAGTPGLFEFRVTPSGVSPSAYSSGVITASPVSNEWFGSASALKAWTANGTLYVSGLQAGEMWQIYNLSGALIYTEIAVETRRATSLPERGIYIVRQGDNAIKVIN